MLATLDGTAYIARGTVHNAVNVRKTRGYIRTALELQMSGLGVTMVESLSQCPTGGSREPLESADWLEKNMIPVFPLGEIKKPAAETAARPAAATSTSSPAGNAANTANAASTKQGVA
jgi:2-oxoglutarate ferredoxin oxidoreductase subunit beta